MILDCGAYPHRFGIAQGEQKRREYPPHSKATSSMQRARARLFLSFSPLMLLLDWRPVDSTAAD
jgi:hypothetical protein